MLPPAGQIFEKLHPLKMMNYFRSFFAIFKQGASRGAASGGSDFLKNDTSLKMLNDVSKLFATFKQGASRGAASGGSDF